MHRRQPPRAMVPADSLPGRTSVVLCRPESPENIGLVARAMKNTGFVDLRIVGLDKLSPEARRTGVHAEDILAGARLFGSLEDALADRDYVLASTARLRRRFTGVSLAEAVSSVVSLAPGARTALLFGNERTGLLSEEVRRANLVFSIPQAGRQPSYNLGAAVLLTLYSLFTAEPKPLAESEPPIPRPEQDAAIALLLRQLEAKRFIHPGNKVHVTDLMHDLLGRLAMTVRDRRFLLALFAKGVDPAPKEPDHDRE